jgi:hypothetical protein
MNAVKKLLVTCEYGNEPSEHFWLLRGLFNSFSCYYATSRTVPGSIPGGVTGDFFRGFPWRNHVPWGRLSLWKWVPGISSGVKAAGAYGWRPTTLVVPNVKKTRGLNLPGTPWATSACCGMTFTFTTLAISNLKKLHFQFRELQLLYCMLTDAHSCIRITKGLWKHKVCTVLSYIYMFILHRRISSSSYTCKRPVY